MTETPHDHAADWQPPRGWVDPRDNPDLPFIDWPTEDDLSDEAWLPPSERLDAEPEHVEPEDNGQRAAAELEESDESEQQPGARSRVPSALGISLTDYSRTPQARGFGSPCSQQMAVVQLTEARFVVHVALAELAAHIMRANERQGYIYRRADTGSYNCRNIAGSSSWSWHAWAVAVDSNWRTNPYTSPLRTDRPRWELDRWNRYGWAWGGDYSGAKDAMHTEFMGTTEDAGRATALARRELSGVVVKPVTPKPTAPSKPTLQYGSKGAAVTELQRDLARIFPAYRHECGSLPATGNFLTVTRCWVMIFQRATDLDDDGVVGPKTWAMLARYGVG